LKLLFVVQTCNSERFGSNKPQLTNRPLIHVDADGYNY